MKAVLVALLAGGCLSSVRSPPPPMQRSPRLGLELAKLELSNGLNVIVVSDRTAPEIQVTMRYRAGAVDEPDGQAGVAHLVQHLMSEQVLGAQTIAAHLDAAATFHDGEVSRDATTFVERSTRDHLDEMLSIEAVRAGLRCASITDAAFERARQAVVAEIHAHAEAIAIDDAVTRALEPEGHPYRAQPAGNADVVAQLTREQACAFADAHYAPNNAVMVVSGKLTADEVAASLQKFVTHIAKRDVGAQAVLPPAPTYGHRVDVEAPVAAPTVVFAWPLASDPTTRARTRALASTLVLYAQNQLKGTLSVKELGDARSSILAIVSTGDAPDTAIHAITQAVQSLDVTFEEMNGDTPVGELAFDRMVAEALYARMAMLAGQGSSRDVGFAAQMLAGQDPTTTLATELSALRTFRRADAGMLAAQVFARPQVVVLTPTGDKTATLPLAIHDGAAPSTLAATPPDLSAVRRTTLPNGMKVVLAPIASVPAVTLDLSFATNGEPQADALAHAMRWNMKFMGDLKQFSAAGGGVHPDVDAQRTHFLAHGEDSNLDTLLAGLLRFVRDGKLEDKSLQPLRARAYTGGNATLELTGGFDPDIATRWIDYLYADWDKSRGGANALTEAQEPSNLAFSIHAAFSYASAYDLDILGTQIVGEVGYRLDNITTVGFHVSGGFQTGNYLIDGNPMFKHTLNLYPFDFGVFINGDFLERFYSSLFIAIHASTGSDNTLKVTDTGITAGLILGVDILDIDRRHDLRLGAYIAGQSELLDESNYQSFTAGLALRH
ncbi:MAG: insulinase family protein [Kofleriaceae bacterium]